MADETSREIPEPWKGSGELARIHLEVLFRKALERAWESGELILAEIWDLVPHDPRELTFEQILAALEKLGVPPGDYYYELSRETWRRESEAHSLRHPAANLPESGPGGGPGRPSRSDVKPILE